MLKRFALSFILGVACFNLAAQEDQSGSSEQTPFSSGIRPGVSDESNGSDNNKDQASDRDEIAYADSGNQQQDRTVRKTNWDNKASWRNDKEAFYRGDSQTQARRDRNEKLAVERGNRKKKVNRNPDRQSPPVAYEAVEK